MTTTDSNITKDMTPVEAANLLTTLQKGHEAAWRSTHEVPWPSAEYESRFQNATEVDGVFREVMWETAQNGMRRPGEPVEQFAERAGSEAGLGDALEAGTETAATAVTPQADVGMTPERAGDRQNEIAVRLLNDPSTPEGQAYARAFSDTAAAYVRELSDRVHAAGDERAHQYGWQITKTAGRLGFGARSYHDPRFGDRRREVTDATGPEELLPGTDQRGRPVMVPLHSGSPRTWRPTGTGEGKSAQVQAGE